MYKKNRLRFRKRFFDSFVHCAINCQVLTFTLILFFAGTCLIVGRLMPSGRFGNLLWRMAGAGQIVVNRRRVLQILETLGHLQV